MRGTMLTSAKALAVPPCSPSPNSALSPPRRPDNDRWSRYGFVELRGEQQVIGDERAML